MTRRRSLRLTKTQRQDRLLFCGPFQVLKVNYVNKTEFRLSNNMKYTIEDVNVYDGIAKDDYVVYTAAANTATDTDTFVKADMISGKITQKDGNDVYVDGNWYTFGCQLQRRRQHRLRWNRAGRCRCGQRYLFYADESGATNVEDYVVVVSDVESSFGQDQVKLLFSDGTKKVVDLAKVGGESQSLTVGSLYTYDTNKDGRVHPDYRFCCRHWLRQGC